MSSDHSQNVPTQAPEARYAYYRRCQEFLRNGPQCKAPAMKEMHICHQHAEQQETLRRRERQRVALGLPNFFADFKTLQRAIGMVVQALIDGRIDRKTAGRLLLEMQTASQLLRQLHRQKQFNHRGHPRLAGAGKATQIQKATQSQENPVVATPIAAPLPIRACRVPLVLKRGERPWSANPHRARRRHFRSPPDRRAREPAVAVRKKRLQKPAAETFAAEHGPPVLD